LVVAVLVPLTAVACAHPASGPPQTDGAGRRLRALDARFVAFTAQRLDDIHDVEPAIVELESLRLEWLDVLGAVEDEGTRLLVLLRLGELHLDLAARVRRVPYAPGLDDAGRAGVDATLSAWALPLEATGHGIVAQVVARAHRARLDGRFVRRARLYQRLHAGQHLDDDDLRVLRSELAAVAFRAPGTLLQAGRIGQRAAR
jgi:hypothetical protein